MTYRERPIAVPGAVLWKRTLAARSQTPILPDGCLDLLWNGDRLFVAGPDTTARWHESSDSADYVALRFSGGTGPALLGVPADELCDQTPDLGELWPAATTRVLTERVAADPAVALQSWATERASVVEVDPLGPRALSLAGAGASAATMAERLGLSARQLHRRCRSMFGYGPRRLGRILRLGRALQQARGGVPLALVAANCGYADQAHLSREVRDLAGMTPLRLLDGLSRSVVSSV